MVLCYDGHCCCCRQTETLERETPTSPAPWKRYLWSDNFVFVIRIAAITPARATDAVPDTRTHTRIASSDIRLETDCITGNRTRQVRRAVLMLPNTVKFHVAVRRKLWSLLLTWQHLQAYPGLAGAHRWADAWVSQIVAHFFTVSKRNVAVIAESRIDICAINWGCGTKRGRGNLKTRWGFEVAP